VDDFANLPAGYLEEHFRPLPGRWPLREELSRIGFGDSRGYFHPFVVIPFAIFYNPNLLKAEEIPRKWQDLLDPRWKGRILMPDSFRIVSLVVRKFMKADFPEHTENLDQNVVHQGSPMDVVSGVDEGSYPLGITNIAFARISRQKNTRIIWPEDGLFCMPQVMVWSKNAPEALLETGDFLFSRAIQEYLALQSFVPASPEVDLHPLVSENDCHLRWNGWDSFLNVIQGRHAPEPGMGKGKGRMKSGGYSDLYPVYPLIAQQILDDYGIREGVCLDIGSGPGYLGIELAKITRLEMRFVDTEPEVLEKAKENAAGLDNILEFTQADVCNLPFEDRFADLIISRGSLWFWEDQVKGLQEIYRVLKDGAVAFVGGGLGRYTPPTMRERLKGKRRKAAQKHGNARFLKGSELQELVDKAGLKGCRILSDVEGEEGSWIEMRK